MQCGVVCPAQGILDPAGQGHLTALLVQFFESRMVRPLFLHVGWHRTFYMIWCASCSSTDSSAVVCVATPRLPRWSLRPRPVPGWQSPSFKGASMRPYYTMGAHMGSWDVRVARLAGSNVYGKQHQR